MKRQFRLRAIVIAIAASVVGTLGAVLLAAWLLVGPGGLALLQGAGLIHSMFVGDYEQEEMVDAALHGMVAGIGDRWSYYLNREQYEDMQLSRENLYVGIGITVSYESEDGLLILSVEPGGPADQVGIEAGDMIIAVDGESVQGEARYDGPDLIRGEAGTHVVVKLLRMDGTEAELEAVRSRVESHPAREEMLEDGIGLVTMTNFYERSAEEAKAAVDALVEQGARALVFDMRGNPGGYLEELIDLLDYLLPEGPIFASHTKSGPERVTNSDARHIDLPMAVLVDEDTYSAAELFAAQLKESVGAYIVGVPTSGKGYSQQTFPLPNGGALAVSTGQYTTGGGTSLIGVGVSLDAHVEQTADDAQLTAAVAHLLEKLD